jgi:hypothetical protein
LQCDLRGHGEEDTGVAVVEDGVGVGERRINHRGHRGAEKKIDVPRLRGVLTG